MFKVSNTNPRTRHEICSKLTIKIPERRHWRRSGIFIVNFEHISATSHVNLISVWTLRTMLRRYHDVVTGEPARHIYLRRLCDVLLKT